MIQALQTERFEKWLDELRDRHARLRIDKRIRRLELGNAGDYKSLGGGLLELRISHGKGYRVYYTWRNSQLILLLAGGDKSTQSKDIEMARKLLKSIDKEDTNDC